MKRLSRVLWLAALVSLWVPSVKAALYQIDTNDQTASLSGYLDISAYAASTGDLWRLLDGDTYVNQFGFNTPIRGLPDGVSLDSFSSSTSTTIYAYAIPEPSTVAFLIIGSLSFILRRKRAQRCPPLPRSSAH